MIDLTIYPDRLARAVKRARERNIIIPTFAQQRNPALIPDKIKAELKSIGLWDVNPRNLFRITWHNEPVPFGGGFGGRATCSASPGTTNPCRSAAGSAASTTWSCPRR